VEASLRHEAKATANRVRNLSSNAIAKLILATTLPKQDTSPPKITNTCTESRDLQLRCSLIASRKIETA